jgi:membrane protein implicated in regulation of membrane protease activity
MELVLITLATFWVWETFRAVMEAYLPRVFTLARPVHPILAAALPLFLLWPNWVAALAVAGVVGLLVAAVDRVFGSTPVETFQRPQRRRSGGLPTLP